MFRFAFLFSLIALKSHDFSVVAFQPTNLGLSSLPVVCPSKAGRPASSLCDRLASANRLPCSVQARIGSTVPLGMVDSSDGASEKSSKRSKRKFKASAKKSKRKRFKAGIKKIVAYPKVSWQYCSRVRRDARRVAHSSAGMSLQDKIRSKLRKRRSTDDDGLEHTPEELVTGAATNGAMGASSTLMVNGKSARHEHEQEAEIMVKEPEPAIAVTQGSHHEEEVAEQHGFRSFKEMLLAKPATNGETKALRSATTHSTDLSGKWQLVVSEDFKTNYDDYLHRLGQPSIVRSVALSIIGMTSEETVQSDEGRELKIRGRNMRGNWERVLKASPGDRPLVIPIITADNETVQSECWWEDNGSVHRSWLHGVQKYGGGNFESRRYLEDEGQTLMCESTFHPLDQSKEKASVVWKFKRVD